MFRDFWHHFGVVVHDTTQFWGKWRPQSQHKSKVSFCQKMVFNWFLAVFLIQQIVGSLCRTTYDLSWCVGLPTICHGLQIQYTPRKWSAGGIAGYSHLKYPPKPNKNSTEFYAGGGGAISVRICDGSREKAHGFWHNLYRFALKG